MNIFGVIILAALLLDYVLNLVADTLNLKHLKKELPEEFSDVYDKEEYQRSQEYTRERTRFGFVNSTFGIAVILIFWFAGGFNWLDHIVRDFGFGELVSGLIYIGLLVFAQTIISLPFSIYSTFVIEERYGFNKTTPGTFVMDRIKGLLLSVVIGGPLLAGVLWFFINAGSLAWLYAWIAVTTFMLIVQFIAPTWIMPLFNKFTPLEDGELRQAIMNMAEKVKFPLQDVFVIDGSKRSAKSNAFFTGFGKNKRIALFDTLIEKHTVGELVAVLAHEVGHYKKKHIQKNLVISILHTGVMLALLQLFLSVPGLFDAFYMDQMSVYAGLIFFGLLFTPIEMILGIVMQLLSRKHEFEADRYAVEVTEDPDSMADALKKLSANNLSNLTPHPFYVFLNYSHPPVKERIEEIRKTPVG